MRFLLLAVVLVVLPLSAHAGEGDDPCGKGSNVALGDTTQPSQVQAEQAELDRLAGGSDVGTSGGRGVYNDYPH